MNIIKNIGIGLGRLVQVVKKPVVVACGLGLGLLGLAPVAHATYTDPAADINSAVAGAASGASTAYTSTLTVLASIVIGGLVIWGLRKGTRPV